MAHSLLKAKGRSEPLGPNWVQKFLNRYTTLRSTWTSAQDKERATIPFDTVLHWFELYRKITQKYSIQMRDSYNMDEKGFAKGQQGKQRAIVPDTFKPSRIQSGNRECISNIEAVSTDGFLLPLFVIFKGKIQQDIWQTTFQRLGEPDGVIGLSENGWTDNILGVKWMQHFDKHTDNRLEKKTDYRMLILDGHDSHISIEVIEFCIARRIILLCLPAHTTHSLQPLDVGIFGPLATVYQRMLADSIEWQGANDIDKVDYLELYIPARREGIKISNIRSAWRESGLFPFQPNFVLMMEYQGILPPDPERPITPPEQITQATFANANGHRVIYTLTPANALEVRNIIERVKGRLSDEEQQAIYKVGKAATVGFATVTITQADCEVLRIGAEKKKQRLNIGAKGHHGKARVLDQSEITRRKAFQTDAQFFYAFDSFISWERKENAEFWRLNKHAVRSAAKEEKATEKEVEKNFTESFKCFTSWCKSPKKSPTKSRSPRKKQQAPLPHSPPPSPSPSPQFAPLFAPPELLLSLKLPTAPSITLPEPIKQQEIQEIREIPDVRRSGRTRRPNPQRIRI